MKLTYLFVLLFCFSIGGICQVEKRSKSTQAIDVHKSQIDSARKRLMYFIESDNMDGVVKEFNQLETLDNEIYLSLHMGEKLYLQYIIRDYYSILETFKLENYTKDNQFYNKIYPQTNDLIESLFTYCSSNQSKVIDQIEQSDLTVSQRKLLGMNFYAMTTGNNIETVSQDSINSIVEKYLESYPDTEYRGYINEFIRYDYSETPWALSFNFPFNSRINKGNLENTFKNGFTLGFGMDGYFYRIVLFTHIALIGGTESLEWIPFSNTSWHYKTKLTMSEGDISLGFLCIDSERFKIAPFIGYNLIAIDPVEVEENENPEYIGTSLTATTLQYGVNVDFHWNSVSNIIFRHEEASTMIRLKYTYLKPKFSNEFGSYEGEVHRISIGFGLYSKALKRNY